MHKGICERNIEIIIEKIRVKISGKIFGKISGNIIEGISGVILSESGEKNVFGEILGAIPLEFPNKISGGIIEDQEQCLNKLLQEFKKKISAENPESTFE